MDDIEKGQRVPTPQVRTPAEIVLATNGIPQEYKKNFSSLIRNHLFKTPLNTGKTLGVVAGSGVAAWYMIPAIVAAVFTGIVPALGYGVGFFAIGYGGKVVADEYEKIKSAKPGP